MAIKIAPAEITFSTAKIDLADNSFAEEVARSLTDTADELMPGNTFETHVAFEDLQIRGADAGEMNLNEASCLTLGSEATASRLYDPRFSILYPRP